MAKGTVRLRDLQTDLKARIARAEAQEAAFVRQFEKLRTVEESLRVQRGEIETLRQMLAMAEKGQPALPTESENSSPTVEGTGRRGVE